METIGYYGPENLLSDYQLYGIHRLTIASAAFSDKYISLARELGSDLVSVTKKRQLKRSETYKKLLSFPPVAYKKEKYKCGDKIVYVVDNNILNKKQLKYHEKYINELEEDGLFIQETDLIQKDWETVEQKESKEIESKL